jgi:GNAT superfamily N-acetyltransferase
MIHIRPYAPGDLESLTDLMSDLGYPTTVDKMERRMKALEAEPNCHTFVSTIDGKVVGMIGIRQVYCYEEDGCSTQVSALVVDKQYEGRGIGTALIKYAENWALDHHSNSLSLTSGMKPERLRAHEFYKKQGFEVTGYRFVKKLR